MSEPRSENATTLMHIKKLNNMALLKLPISSGVAFSDGGSNNIFVTTKSEMNSISFTPSSKHSKKLFSHVADISFSIGIPKP